VGVDVCGRGPALARLLVQSVLAGLANYGCGMAATVNSVSVLAHRDRYLVCSWCGWYVYVDNGYVSIFSELLYS
jgi:hypothetical protein